MKNTIIRKTFAVILTVFSTQNSFAATQYVTMSTSASNYKGTVPVYKDSNGLTQWSRSGENGVLSKNVYLVYLGSAGNYYKVQWGDLEGYVKKIQGTIVESLPSGTTKLSTRKRTQNGVYSNYIAFNTYVIYMDQGIGKIKWATYCNDINSAIDENKWIVPGFAYLYSLS